MTASSKRPWQATPLTYVALVIGLVASVFPIYWMFTVATKTNDTINDVPPSMLPGGNFVVNATNVLDNPTAGFLHGLMNSLIVSSIVTISVVIFSSLAGFAFAKLRFRGRNALLLTIVATMMVPVQLGLIPLYLMMVKFGWHGELQSVIVPFLVSGFGVFLMRQYTSQAISDELIEAGRIDGCSMLRIFWNIVLPAVRPAAAVLGLLTFMQTWNEFIIPFTMLNQENPTVQLSLNNLASAYYTDYAQVFAGTAMATVPLLAVFILFGRQIIGGIMEGAVKG